MILGNYTLQDVIGTGGMGSVYRAIHTTTQQAVAVKVMSEDHAADPLLRQRFEQEYTVTNRLDHPHIVRALDFGIQENRLYLVMELIEGRSLAHIVRSHGPLTESEAFRIAREIAGALQYAHENRLIHRDVKPDNVLLTASGQSKLTDLGLVKDLDGELALTKPRSSLGTISYMAPEQFGGAEEVDLRCDVYGLAGTVYFMLTGVVPFPGRGNMTVLQKKLLNELVPPCQLLPSLRPEVSAIVCRALHVLPKHRPSSCWEFAACLVASNSPELPLERRVAQRFPSMLAARCFTLGGDFYSLGEILDVSRTGLCITLDRTVGTEEMLRVEVFDESNPQNLTWCFKTCWIRPKAGGGCRLGGVFERELTDDELDLLLGSLPRTNKMG